MLQVTAAPIFRGTLWTFVSKEHYNYTYDLEPRNLKHMVAFLSAVSGCSTSEIERYVDEIVQDGELRAHILRLTEKSAEKYTADMQVRYGRRIGWYALVRAKKPKVVVETGVDKGLGSVVIAAALSRNASENHPGQLVAIDINPAAGYLLGDAYERVVKLVIKDSLMALTELASGVDFFIHDSNHDAEFEAAEYEKVQQKLTTEAIVVSDNAEHTDELVKFAAKTGRNFLFFAEKPQDHWWPGEGIGVAYFTN
jgi:predicted O-methyltransferase YrrM